MRPNLKKYFTNWWVPISVNVVALGVFLLGDSILKRDWVIDVALALFLANLVGTAISAVVQIAIKKWYFAIIQVAVSGTLFWYVSLILALSPPDHYGVHKEIPEGIQIDEPMERKPTLDDFDNYDIVLTHSHQPGIYSYHTNYVPKELGVFYLKVFEVTTNDFLSANRIRERSQVEVTTLDTTIREGEFTIYEGSWGDFYGARIELWFKPNNRGSEYRVTHRNYLVEGWMR